VTLFTLGAPQTVRLEARASDPGGDPVLELYDASGAMVVTDDDSGGGLSIRAPRRSWPPGILLPRGARLRRQRADRRYPRRPCWSMRP
jgi:hypothetical protein